MKKRYHALDALRGIFAVLIVLYHMYDYNFLVDNFFINKSLIFVDYFFVLSGFVIMHNYKNRISSIVEFKKFIINRFWRLYPLHLFCICVLFILELTKYILYSKGILQFPPFATNTIEKLIGQLFLINSAGIIVGENLTGQWNYPSWSISGEYIAYILFAILLLIFRKYIIYTGFILIGIILFFLVSNFANINIISTTEFGFIRAIYGFFIGVLIYCYISNSKVTIGKYLATFLQISVTILIIIMMYFWDFTKNYSAFFPILFSLGILGFTREDTFFSKPLLKKSMQILGERSYSIYMIHVIFLLVSEIVINRILKIDDTLVSYLFPFLITIIIIYLSGFTYKFVEIYFYHKHKK